MLITSQHVDAKVCTFIICLLFHSFTGSTLEDYTKLSNLRICPTVYFAGEHTETEYIGTVYGAYLSGMRVAGNLMKDKLLYGLDPDAYKYICSSGINMNPTCCFILASTLLSWTIIMYS